LVPPLTQIKLFADGRTQLRLTPVELIERLAA
jgi:hypothetical protein